VRGNVTYDAIVVGLGASGSAAAYHLARRGRKVLGLERFGPLHDRGSSHGHTRIIRLAYFEHPDYVPLLRRAYELWEALARESGQGLLRICGGLMVGPPDGLLVSGSRHSALLHDLPHELLTPEEVNRRFPPVCLEEGEVALYEPQAGILFPEACIEAHLRGAVAHGAELHFEEPLVRWEAREGRVLVRTPRGPYEAEALVVTAGAWIGRILADLHLPLVVERQVVFWFTPRTPELFGPERLPIFLWEVPDGFFYGIPAIGGRGVKVARHHGGELTDPDHVRPPRPEEAAWLIGYLERRLPHAAGSIEGMVTCLYTNTPDEHFIIDRHPAHPNVVFASACSGHGFKFTAAVGQILAELVTDGRTDLSIGFLSLRRFL